MNKLIRISPENEIQIHPFPDGDWKKKSSCLNALIGVECQIYERVRPRRLYYELGASKVCMLVDEDGIQKELPLNIVGSWLYGTDLHGDPIVGTILIIGETVTLDGVVYEGIPEKEFCTLYSKLQRVVELAKGRSGKEKRTWEK